MPYESMNDAIQMFTNGFEKEIGTTDTLIKEVDSLGSSMTELERTESQLATQGKKITSSATAGNMTFNDFLQKSGLGRTTADSVSALVRSRADSAFGKDGAITSGVLSNAAFGAIMGLVTGMKNGGLIGAGIGAASGFFSGWAQEFTDKDAAFKTYVQNSVEKQLTATSDRLSRGSQLAAVWEYDNGLGTPGNTYFETYERYMDAQSGIDAAMGIGYNRIAQLGMAEHTEWMEGENGEKLKQYYEAIGEFYASSQNEWLSLEREYQEAAIEKIEDLGLDINSKADVLKIERILELAESDAQNAYNASWSVQKMQESENSLIESVRDNTAKNDDYWDADYEKSAAYSKGLMATKKVDPDSAAAITYLTGVDTTQLLKLPDTDVADLSVCAQMTRDLLLEVKGWNDMPKEVSVNVTGNTVEVHKDIDVAAIVETVAEGVKLALLGGVAV